MNQTASGCGRDDGARPPDPAATPAVTNAEDGRPSTTPSRAAARRRWVVFGGSLGSLSVIWLLAGLAGWDEGRVEDWIPTIGPAAAVVIVGLLVLDTVAPIPGAILLLASGAILGPVMGSIVNVVGLDIEHGGNDATAT